jgi:thiol-disulfide isomerase/thioredoxin
MSLSRRTWVAAALAAGAAGAGVSWWRLRPNEVLTESEQAFWGLSFNTPDGRQTLDLGAWRGKPLLLNFWATWCPPCVEELPLLNAFYEQHKAKGWQVLGLAVDQPASVIKFTEKLPIVFPVGMAGLAGADLSRTLGNPTGGLPYTVVFGADGVVLHRKIGKVSQQDLDQWVQLV